ncbi:ATP-binding protein [Actinophytocola glycyrrhizae]|uniref:ATP-binding protein n=1 Tax=Actinophytocola glycyrrhizae TaxID=2044873 RepID=A0ABV9SBF7_9PSEU
MLNRQPFVRFRWLGRGEDVEVTDTAPGVVGRLPTEIRLATVDPGFRAALSTWLRAPLDGCTPGVIREAAFVLGELVANAFDHAAPPYRVRVADRSAGHIIRLAVTDSSPGRADAWPLGRGLRLVRGMCPRWGVEQARDAGGAVAGKTVWALLPVLVPPRGAAHSR